MPFKCVLTPLHLALSGILALAPLGSGCTSSRGPTIQPPPSPPSFPPQRVMESGNYAQFLVENEWVLQNCAGGPGCEVALFNLGFAYAYTQSPYRNLTKALHYFSDLSQKYPQSPFAFQGRAWMAFINDHLALEEARRQLQANLRNREGTIRSLRAQLDRSRAIDVEMEKKERELLR